MKKVSTLTGILVIIAVAIVLVGGAMLIQNVKIKNQNDSAKFQNETADSSAKALATADWKTYKNGEYGFEFKYPSNWILNNQKYTTNAVSVISPENDLLAKKTFEGSYYYINFSVNICDRQSVNCLMGGTYVDMKNKTILDFLNDQTPYRSYQKSSSMPEVNVDGVKGYGIIAGGFGANYEIILERNNKIYVIDFPSSENELTLEQKIILSTFKFTK